jgi:hypothetical protein
MKRIYQRLNLSAFPCTNGTKLFFACAIAFLSISTTLGQELVFRDPVLVSGTAGQNDAIYRFPNVNATVDALVTVKNRSASNVIIQDIDVTSTGWSKAFQPQIGINGGIVSGTKDWWIEFEISFVKTGTSVKADVSEFSMTSLDVDGDNLMIREYVEVYGADSYYCEAGTELNNSVISNDDDDNDEPKNKNYRMLGPIKNYLDIDTAGTKVMVTSKFIKQDQIKLKIGARSTGVGSSNAAMRYNSIWFRSFNYQVVQFLPVKLTSFTVRTADSKKVILNWSTTQEKNSSHFTIEKSLNGKDFSDAGMLFSIGESDLPQQYSFTNELRAGEKGLVYYRLKMVDLDGKFQHSPVKVVRIEENANESVRVYPNPVANDLRITLPASWQDQKVVVDIYSTGGVLVKKVITNNAGQTETINVRALQAGVYMMRTTSGTETVSQQIMKTN